jgi:hypothetical protein
MFYDPSNKYVPIYKKNNFDYCVNYFFREVKFVEKELIKKYDNTYSDNTYSASNEFEKYIKLVNHNSIENEMSIIKKEIKESIKNNTVMLEINKQRTIKNILETFTFEEKEDDLFSKISVSNKKIAVQRPESFGFFDDGELEYISFMFNGYMSVFFILFGKDKFLIIQIKNNYYRLGIYTHKKELSWEPDMKLFEQYELPKYEYLTLEQKLKMLQKNIPVVFDDIWL